MFPAGSAVILLLVGVQEPDGIKSSRYSGWPIRKSHLAGLKADYWSFVVIGVPVTVARFNDAFLVLTAQSASLSVAMAPTVLVWLSLISASLASPAGALSDKIGLSGLSLSGQLPISWTLSYGVLTELELLDGTKNVYT